MADRQSYSAMKEKESWNLEFAESCGDIVGNEMEYFGVQLWLAPALNIHRCIDDFL